MNLEKELLLLHVNSSNEYSISLPKMNDEVHYSVYQLFVFQHGHFCYI